MHYDEMLKIQAICAVCYGSPPDASTDYECPDCHRIVKEEISEEFYKTHTNEEITKRIIDFWNKHRELSR
jgi:hypothetical protein